ncbi:hypothetical protein COU89_00855 [Candidatus Roizmanbacteria bacterium CG10_big_fil_rev_8_21_14_0_10_45_7]|uniref:DUF1573 domain-containing protein n=1 Tax=Candidatus Roizmanbacteria bacterium CG10_big_fil_rev_8_21_14_0_10_45_7 TaxID=1974854 RepID=A0A2M8KVG0_9BACT|nr:MAG: hypothetical protein COU89_00855 [Candidatus Roizmanbacteria bacterium CG10_big_fil_rev_8_21_14_0_10_45_7]
MSHQREGFDRFIVGTVIITVLLLGIAVFLGSKMGAAPQITVDSLVALSIKSSSFDWETIDYDEGIVSKTFPIKNTGSSVLKLYNVETSCMCTTAQIKTPEVTSKKFKMHETSANIIEVRPGETAKLIVEFDPAFHGPSGVGPINRIITMSTNDVKNPTLTFTVSGNVVKK